MPQNKPTVRQTPKGWETRIRFGSKQRSRFLIASSLTEGQAIERALALSGLAERIASVGQPSTAIAILKKGASVTTAREFEKVRKTVDLVVSGKVTGEPVAPAGCVTFKQLATRWTSGELTQLYPDHVKFKKSVSDDIQRFEAHLFKSIGSVPLVNFRLEDGERAMRDLPKKLSVASRRHYAQLISRVMSLAVYPARVIPHSPIPKGWLPKLGERKAFGFLYPTEDAKLLACTEVPLIYRLIYGFLAREGMRRSEALGGKPHTDADGKDACTMPISFGDIDLVRGLVKLDENKTDDPRFWALDPGTTLALKIWKDHFRTEASSTDAVFIDPTRPVHVDKLATLLREHLSQAGVDRAELFQSSKTRSRLRAHDLRATFVTLSLANGKTETWVSDRTGHQSSEQMNNYRRGARAVAEVGLGTLLPLDQAIPEFAKLAKVGQKVGQDGSEREKAKHLNSENNNHFAVVHEGGVEPPRLAAPEPKGEMGMQEGTRGQESSNADAGGDTTKQDTGALAHPRAHPEDLVTLALAEALRGATAAGQWDVVAALAGEISRRGQG